MTILAFLKARDHPRIRGEHRRRRGRGCFRCGSSPHTRGAPFQCFAQGPFPRIIPAYAGSTTSCRSRCRSRPDHPRIRGEHSTAPFQAPRKGGSSPHTRGALSGQVRGVGESRIIPAYAGSTSGLPLAEWRRAGSSPHTRGARAPAGPPPTGRRIIPAYAGSTTGEDIRDRGAADHPRIRGEHADAIARAIFGDGSSPHTRGALGRRHRLRLELGIIPAYAGSTPWSRP